MVCHGISHIKHNKVSQTREPMILGSTLLNQLYYLNLWSLYIIVLQPIQTTATENQPLLAIGVNT